MTAKPFSFAARPLLCQRDCWAGCKVGSLDIHNCVPARRALMRNVRPVCLDNGCQPVQGRGPHQQRLELIQVHGLNAAVKSKKYRTWGGLDLGFQKETKPKEYLQTWPCIKSKA